MFHNLIREDLRFRHQSIRKDLRFRHQSNFYTKTKHYSAIHPHVADAVLTRIKYYQFPCAGLLHNVLCQFEQRVDLLFSFIVKQKILAWMQTLTILPPSQFLRDLLRENWLSNRDWLTASTNNTGKQNYNKAQREGGGGEGEKRERGSEIEQQDMMGSEEVVTMTEGCASVCICVKVYTELGLCFNAIMWWAP